MGGGGDDLLVGGSGYDVLGGSGRDTADGGAGADTFVTGTLRRQIKVLPGADDVVLSGPDSFNPNDFDRLVSVERVKFVDGTLHFDPAGTAGQVWRLYGAAFGRGAETTGLSGWVEALDAGALALAGAAGRFLGSAEFAQRHGQLDDAGFAARLYGNVLGRAPDAGGLANWTAQLAAGASRAEVLLGFSESAEYKAATAASAHQLWTVDPEAVEVLRIYMTALDRLPDRGGLASWTSLRDTNKLTSAELGDAFVNSAEFQGRFGALSNEDFVARMCPVALDRPADAAGHADWTSGLDGGAIGRRDVVLGFAHSEETTQKLLPLVADGIAFA